jgi:hypothetical protein
MPQVLIERVDSPATPNSRRRDPEQVPWGLSFPGAVNVEWKRLGPRDWEVAERGEPVRREMKPGDPCGSDLASVTKLPRRRSPAKPAHCRQIKSPWNVPSVITGLGAVCFAGINKHAKLHSVVRFGRITTHGDARRRDVGLQSTDGVVRTVW